MLRLRVREVCPDSRVFRLDGARLRAAIEATWGDDTPVEVDFEGETIASLFVDHDAELIRARLRLTGLTEPDRGQLNRLVANRRAERSAA